ncbi:hypothetical protein PAPYR_1024 [Paratrimastix pyriformis]|uniref:Uncharacterized protein n=1 Tax=Paratrimastix pyriformis TaxID=342808 RepID=A0ABQ8UXT7_9EUKA|nr:hypothetical protein PAPYR_1024 [Paratrimastix pyriformis]
MLGSMVPLGHFSVFPVPFPPVRSEFPPTIPWALSVMKSRSLRGFPHGALDDCDFERQMYYSYLVRGSLRRHEQWKYFLVHEKALRGTNKCAVLRSETYGTLLRDKTLDFPAPVCPGVMLLGPPRPQVGAFTRSPPPLSAPGNPAAPPRAPWLAPGLASPVHFPTPIITTVSSVRDLGAGARRLKEAPLRIAPIEPSRVLASVTFGINVTSYGTASLSPALST